MLHKALAVVESLPSRDGLAWLFCGTMRLVEVVFPTICLFGDYLHVCGYAEGVLGSIKGRKKGIREELEEETICEGRKAEVSLVHARHPFWTQSLQSQILGFTFFLMLHSLAHDLCGSIWVRGTRAYGRGVGRGGVEGPGIFKSRCLA